MHHNIRVQKSVPQIVLCLALASTAFAQSGATKAARPDQQAIEDFSPTKNVSFKKAFVIDDRLSALRRDADIKSQIAQRPRLGRAVYIIGSKSGTSDQPKFYRVAVNRRTRGWIHEAAIAVPGRAGEDARIMRLIETLDDGMDRIKLCRLLIEQFSRSPLAPRALLRLGEEADRAASALAYRARRRLAGIDKQESKVRLRDFYLNDPGLDRYSKLRIKFDFDETTKQYVYDGQAYKEIVRRFPDTDEARQSRKRLDLAAKPTR